MPPAPVVTECTPSSQSRYRPGCRREKRVCAGFPRWSPRFAPRIGTAPSLLSLESRDLDAVTPLWIADLAPHVDFTGLRVHCDEAEWSRSPLDTMVLPFAAFLGEALGGSRVAMIDVGFAMVHEEVYHSGRLLPYCVLHDIEAADLMATVLEGVLHMGATAAICGTYSDFDPRLFHLPPLAQTPRRAGPAFCALTARSNRPPTWCATSRRGTTRCSPRRSACGYRPSGSQPIPAPP